MCPHTGSFACDLMLYVYDSKMNPVDSNGTYFRLAGKNALTQVIKNACPKILEPFYDFEIFIPSDQIGDVQEAVIKAYSEKELE